MAQDELLERIAASLAVEPGGLAAEEIARRFLRLRAPAGGAVARLVRALLGGQAGFRESAPEIWSLAPPGAAELEPPVLLLSFAIPPGTTRAPWLWSAHGRLWGRPREEAIHRGAEVQPALQTLRAWLGRHPVATLRPGALGQWLGAQERIHAWSEVEPRVLDLAGWARLLADESAGPGAGAESGGASGACALEDLEQRLERVIETARARGWDSWAKVAAAPRAARREGDAAVWQTPRAFGREALEALPSAPGIYRFFDRRDRLLYVGKSKDLRRRVGSYFRPLDARSRRRAALLDRLHRIEHETTGTELEALIREMGEIRERKPEWNVQIELQTAPAIPLRERELAFLLPDSEQLASLFVVSAERAALRRIPVDGLPSEEELTAALRAFFSEGHGSRGFRELPAPQPALVRRWLSWSPPTLTLLSLADFQTYQAVAAALLREILSHEENPPTGRIELRGPAFARAPGGEGSTPGGP